MKRISQAKTKSYRPVKLYLDDIQAICSIFEESGVEYHIRTDTHEFSSYSDCQNNLPKTRMRRLEILSSNPYLDVDLREYHATLFALDDDNNSIGLFSKIDTYIKSTLGFRSIMYSWLIIACFHCAALFLLALNLLLPENNYDLGTIYWSTIAWACSWAAVVSFMQTKIFCLIFPYEKHKAPSFFTRNKDAILVKIIGALLLLAVAFFAGKYSN